MKHCSWEKFVFVILLLTCSSIYAEEGMWMPQQIPQLASGLRSLGFQGDPQAFADLTGQPMGAVVSLGGCTASFVSPDGLIVTNHHCVVGSLQFNSTPQRNLLREGYLAKSREEELSNGPGSRVFVTTSVKDVTEAITGKIDPKLTDRRRYDIIERRTKERIAACEQGGLRCNVAAFFEGLKYFEIAQLEIQDVRLVYSPHEGIGVFGGETDNWRWPRHTGDWSFYRAYVSPQGKPAPFAKENVPYKPKHYLKVSPAGVKPGDLVFVVGYPGRTFRHQIHAQVKETTEWTYPRSIRLAQEQLALIDRLTKENPDLAIKLAGRIQGLNNGLTNQKGVLEGLTKGGALALKESREKELVQWIQADSARKQKFGDVLPALQTMQAESEKTRERDAILQRNLTAASSLLSAAQTIYKLSTQRPLKDADRDPSYQERNWSRLREGLDRMQRSLDASADRAFLRWAFGLAANLSADQRIEVLDAAIGWKVGMAKEEADRLADAYLEKLYAGTKLVDKNYRLGLMEKSTAELESSGDTFLAMAAMLFPVVEKLEERDKERAGAYARLRPRYMEALLAKSGGLVAPDANGTLRVTYGQVKGVDARDGMFYKPLTTLAGIVEKHTGEGEFDAPQRQLDAIQALRSGKKTPFLDAVLKDVPVNFLSTVDTTGGNSGSPTLNGKGELVGLLFDGTYESVSSNFLFDVTKTRSIHVESRYLLWNMAEVDGAGHLLKEMGIQ